MLAVLIRYKGKEENVKRFVKEMISLGITDQIRNEEELISLLKKTIKT